LVGAPLGMPYGIDPPILFYRELPYQEPAENAIDFARGLALFAPLVAAQFRNWLCFLESEDPENLRKYLYSKYLYRFGPLEIGFVLHNRAPFKLPVPDLVLRASSFRPKAGDWLCFFALAGTAYYRKYLS